MKSGQEPEGSSQELESVKGSYVAHPLECVECHTLSVPDARHWRAYRIDDPTEDEPPAVAFYCPVCAEREFGSLGYDTGRNTYW